MEQPIHSCWTLTKNGNAEHCQTRAGELHCWTSWSSPIGPATLGYWFAKGHFKLTRKSPRECGKWPSLTSSLSACRLLDFESRLTSGPRGPKTSMKRTCSVRATTNMAEQEGDATFSFVALEPLQLAKDNQFPLYHIGFFGINMTTSEVFIVKDGAGTSETQNLNSRCAPTLFKSHLLAILMSRTIEDEYVETFHIPRSVGQNQMWQESCDNCHVIVFTSRIRLFIAEAICIGKRHQNAKDSRLKEKCISSANLRCQRLKTPEKRLKGHSEARLTFLRLGQWRSDGSTSVQRTESERWTVKMFKDWMVIVLSFTKNLFVLKFEMNGTFFLQSSA